MPHIDASGVKLYVEETGIGYPIVFVHEFGSDFREWETQVRYFSRAYRCVTYNARGYPPSDVPSHPEQYGWEFAVSDLFAVMDGLKIDRAHIVGLSMGGYAALQFGLKHAERASAIVAAGAGSGSAPSQRGAFLKEAPALSRSFREKGIEAMAVEMGHHPTRIQLRYKDPRGWQDFVDHLAQHSVDGMANTMARYQALRPSLHDFKTQFAQMKVPVLLVVGDEDTHCLETNLMLKSVIPGAGLWIAPNTGHAINLEEPAAFNAQVESFLAQVENTSWRRAWAQR